MFKEEKKITELYGKESPFTVPAGYFDSLTDSIMGKLPEQEAQVISIESHKTLWLRMPIRKLAAAVAVIALIGGGVSYALRQNTGQQKQMATSSIHTCHTMTSEDADFEQMADYTMLDSQDIYASLIAEN